ncbi:hypothetical protein ACLK2E_14825 [Escherichia coli]
MSFGAGGCISDRPSTDGGAGAVPAQRGRRGGAAPASGRLVGNGERTGNVCLVTLAMNLYSQGVDPLVRRFSGRTGGVEMLES